MSTINRSRIGAESWKRQAIRRRQNEHIPGMLETKPELDFVQGVGRTKPR